MSRWILITVLAGAGVLALATNLKPAAAEDKAAAEEKAEREVDLKVLADPSHEKMNLTAPDTFDVLFKTTAGEFTVQVHREWAPNGADRFYSLVKNGYYDGNKFFRVVKDFVVQWGLHGSKDVNAAWYDPKNKAAVNLKDDPVKKSNVRGTLTFANAGPNTRSTQLFINLGDNKFLDDPKKMRGSVFAPFAKVKGEGMKVVEKLYQGYGEPPPNVQGAIVEHGNKILDEFFPKLDGIITATVVEDEKDEKAGE